MDWYTIWETAMITPSKIIILIFVLATVATYCVYFFYNTGIFLTALAFFVMLASGVLGHSYFITNDISFDYDSDRAAIIGATLSMAISFVLSVIIIRFLADILSNKNYVLAKDQAKSPSDKNLFHWDHL